MVERLNSLLWSTAEYRLIRLIALITAVGSSIDPIGLSLSIANLSSMAALWPELETFLILGLYAIALCPSVYLSGRL